MIDYQEFNSGEIKIILYMRIYIVLIFLVLTVTSCNERFKRSQGESEKNNSEIKFFTNRIKSQENLEAILSPEPKVLKVIDGCILVDKYNIIWPYGYTIIEDGKSIVIVDDNDTPVAMVGERINLSGGVCSECDEAAIEKITNMKKGNCKGEFWIVGEVLE